MAEGGVKFVWPPISLGWVLAFLILVLVIVLLVIGRISGLEAWLIGGLAAARLL